MSQTKIKSNYRSTSLSFLFIGLIGITYLVSRNESIKSFIYSLLFLMILYSWILIHHSHLLELRENEVVIKNRFFSFIKPRILKYEDLSVELKYGKGFDNSHYISLERYGISIKLAFEGINFDDVIEVFKKHGVICKKPARSHL